LTLYPNPAHSRVWIQAPQASQLRVVDLQGREVAVRAVPMNRTDEYELDVSQLPNGLYLLQMQNQAGGAQTQRLVVQH
jgi:hypothetical protein